MIRHGAKLRPTAEIALMGPEGAIDIIHRRDLATSPTPAVRRRKLIDDYKARFANPYWAVRAATSTTC